MSAISRIDFQVLVKLKNSGTIDDHFSIFTFQQLHDFSCSLLVLGAFCSVHSLASNKKI